MRDSAYMFLLSAFRECADCLGNAASGTANCGPVLKTKPPGIFLNCEQYITPKIYNSCKVHRELKSQEGKERFHPSSNLY